MESFLVTTTVLKIEVALLKYVCGQSVEDIIATTTPKTIHTISSASTCSAKLERII